MDGLYFALLIAIRFPASVMGTMIGMAMLVLLPVMIFLGIPVHAAVATGRFSMVGTSIGNISKLSRSNQIKMRYAVPFAVAGVISSLIGA